MNYVKPSSSWRGLRCGLAAGLVLLCLAVFASAADIQSYANLPVIKPVKECADLVKGSYDSAVNAKVTIESATVVDTEKGQYCKVLGNIEPTVGFEVDLPVAKWTQRFLQGGCGGLCGMRGVGITRAGSCSPALNGEFVVAGDDMGHTAQMGSPSEAEFGGDPQKRIDFAYRGNHVTTLIAKALIKTYYGQAPRYSYFVGCSDGGREALIEAQRFPEDFDGVAAGDPAALFVNQNSFYHAWTALTNRRADGTNILLPAKRQLVHDTVVAQCDTLSGVKDALLQDPRACNFNPASLRCPAGAPDTAKCLTDEEVAVVQQHYDGATDGQGHRFTLGAQRGSEAQWYLPATPTGNAMGIGMASRMVSSIILPTLSPADADVTKFAFTKENFERMSQMAPLYNATNTNLKPFAARGGKLILYHGWSDTSITPGVSIAYYQGVQKFMGATATDQFMRLFLIPGMGHCMGGDGYDDFDVLSPLMAWTEKQQAPAQLLAGKTVQQPRGGGAGPGGPAGGAGPGGPAGGGAPAGAVRTRAPYASPTPTLLATRPVYPYPNIPHYIGQGDPKDAANYVSIKSPVTVPQVFNDESEKLMSPNNQKNYGVKDGQLVVLSSR